MQTRDPPWSKEDAITNMEPEGSFYFARKRW